MKEKNVRKFWAGSIYSYFQGSLPGYTLVVRFEGGWVIVQPECGAWTTTIRPPPGSWPKAFYGEYRLMARTFKQNKWGRRGRTVKP